MGSYTPKMRAKKDEMLALMASAIAEARFREEKFADDRKTRSGELDAAKRYEMMCEALGVTPPEACFVDDLGVNLKPAKAMGMTVVKVPFDDYGQAIDELAAVTNLNLRES